ncbi:MAG: LON peptidase substrate-binding domain-containing protein [Deltaproteobacteria bacterium]|nr:LON peptidase substrate-binding domain-containing protein [Deltaproteobacteria bacterium]
MPDLEAVLIALRRLKVFPLPQGVLLPGSALPLHVFEPRYRALVAEALRTDKVLAVATLAPGWEGDYEGRPALRPIAGVGIIDELEELPDGRYNLLVRGVARVRISGEHPADKPFREVIAEIVSEPSAFDSRDVDTVRRAVLQLSESLPGDLAQALAMAAARIPDPGTLCDVVAAAVLEEPEALQGVLDTVDVQERVSRVLGEIGALLLAAHPRPSDELLS